MTELNNKLQLMPKFQAAYLALQKARSVDEVKRVRDQAEAIRLYVRQQNMGLEMQNAAAEIKLRAERRAGEMLAKASLHKGGRPSNNQSQRATSFPATLKELEINKSQSERWQSIATLPKTDFEGYICRNLPAS